MKITKTILITITLLSTLFAVPATFAIDEYNVSKGTTVDGSGVAFRGNDVVARVSGLGVVPGQAKHSYMNDGVAYYFASEDALNQFSTSPEKYMPQFGGYCAFGVSLGKKLDGSPRYADIIDGKLYLFLNADVLKSYKKDKANVIAKAVAKWPSMHHLSVAHVNGIRH